MYWAERPNLFIAPAKESDPAKRALLVLKWFLSTLRQQYSHRPDRKKGKPLNPFLGELFLGHWATKEGATELVAEQVSHHPPATAFHIWNEEYGVQLQGYNSQKTRFDRTVRISRPGAAVLHLDHYDEDFLVQLPGFHLEGLIPPPPTPEVDSEKPVYIQSSSGFTAKIDFSGKGWFRGQKNSFSAVLYATADPMDILYSAEGQWSGSFIIKDSRTNQVFETYDTNSPISSMVVPPLDEQDPLESRRAWSKVTSGINAGNVSVVNNEKSKIETRQRQMRKEEEAEGREWPRRYFKQVQQDPRVEELLSKIGGKLDPDQTGGIWQWDEEKYRKIKAIS
jgi:oxysterol-binding protein-related protein 9/10/11